MRYRTARLLGTIAKNGHLSLSPTLDIAIYYIVAMDYGQALLCCGVYVAFSCGLFGPIVRVIHTQS